MTTNQVLTNEQVEEFVARGFIHLPHAIPPAFVEEATDNLWTRLGYVEDDPSTWTEARIHTPKRRRWELREVAPVVWGATCDLVGGPGRVAEPLVWFDSFVVNLGVGADEPWKEPSVALPGWHKDGDFFRHFLDSPEQGLLTFALYSDVRSRGGATMILPQSVGAVARYLAAHPEGLHPRDIDYPTLLKDCHEVVEATGDAGDVYLLHPYMFHAQSQNVLRAKRVIANPAMALREPMRFDRDDGSAYSVVERTVLDRLGVERLGFHPTGPREEVVPERIRVQAERKVEEDRRLAALRAAGSEAVPEAER
jgi:hypothetical protein